jgi:UDP-2,4-diacetamido-2,4,6-trideoxy-beta-L-altropyranose hydrolase
MKIIIRADGGKNIGMGHIMRTSVLGEELRKYADVSYLCLNEEEYREGIKYLKENSYDVLSFYKDEIKDGLKSLDYDCLLVDDYKVDKEFFNSIKSKGTFIGYFDDNKEEEYPVDFIINQNPYAQDLNYKKDNYLGVFLGSKYALLRKEFRDLPPFHVRNEIKDIMVTLGGSDINRITEKIVVSLLDTMPDTVFHVVIGPAFPKGIMENINDNRIKKYYNPKMSKLMLNCDLAISSCGSTLYELAACGTPTLGIVVADNQILAAKKLNELGIIESSKIEEIPQKVVKMTYEKRVEMSAKARKLVDGLGAERLAKELISSIKNCRRV